MRRHDDNRSRLIHRIAEHVRDPQLRPECQTSSTGFHPSAGHIMDIRKRGLRSNWRSELISTPVFIIPLSSNLAQEVVHSCLKKVASRRIHLARCYTYGNYITSSLFSNCFTFVLLSILSSTRTFTIRRQICPGFYFVVWPL
jgi:hypothetical protein